MEQPMEHEDRFETLYRILSDQRFLAREGLGNEVPYFIETYDIAHQDAVYRKREALEKRLESMGIAVASIGLFDFAIEHFESANELEDLFSAEKTVPKTTLLEEMVKMLSIENVLVPEIAQRARDKEARLVMIYQVGEVYPYLRTHEILSSLQSTLADRPVIVFFPGTYTTSYKEGFQLSLFGTQSARYYRAFKLDEYLSRGIR
jgi:hypothetical protein